MMKKYIPLIILIAFAALSVWLAGWPMLIGIVCGALIGMIHAKIDRRRRIRCWEKERDAPDEF